MKILFIAFFLLLNSGKENDALKYKSVKLWSEINNELTQNKIIHEYIYIVLPEYVTYDITQNKIEIIAVKFLKKVNLDAAAKISLGPFQMSTNFIYNNIVKSKLYKNDIDFILVKKYGINYLVDNIEKYSELNFQIKVLKCFIENNKFVDVNFRSKLIRYLYLYNTGKTLTKKTNISTPIFSKIKTNSLSYVNWGIYFYENNFLFGH
jgi:hypothetical protein